MALLLMRHGPTQLNNGDLSKDRIRGWLDVPLSPEGHAIAEQLAAHASAFPLADLRTSDLSRASTTAAAIAKVTGLPISSHMELRPWNLGVLSGQTTDKVMPVIKNLVSHPDQKAPGGESFQSFVDRYATFIAPLLADDQLHGIVTHIRNIKTIEALIAGKGDLDRKTWDQVPAVDPGGMVIATKDLFEPLSNKSANTIGAGS